MLQSSKEGALLTTRFTVNRQYGREASLATLWTVILAQARVGEAQAALACRSLGCAALSRIVRLCLTVKGLVLSYSPSKAFPLASPVLPLLGQVCRSGVRYIHTCGV